MFLKSGGHEETSCARSSISSSWGLRGSFPVSALFPNFSQKTQKIGRGDTGWEKHGGPGGWEIMGGWEVGKPWLGKQYKPHGQTLAWSVVCKPCCSLSGLCSGFSKLTPAEWWLADILIPFNRENWTSMMWWSIWTYFWGEAVSRNQPQWEETPQAES